MRMHTKVIAGLMLLGAMAMSASADTVKISWGYDQSSATANFSNGESLATFCLEDTEYFVPGHSYLYTIDSVIYKGGNQTGLGYSYLTTGAALLYKAYLRGELDAKLVQDGIWHDQGYGFNYVTALLDAKYLDTTKWNGTTEIVNLYVQNEGAAGDGYTFNTLQRQSYIYSVPEGSMTVSLLGFGLIGLGMLRRKLA